MGHSTGSGSLLAVQVPLSMDNRSERPRLVPFAGELVPASVVAALRELPERCTSLKDVTGNLGPPDRILRNRARWPSSEHHGHQVLGGLAPETTYVYYERFHPVVVTVRLNADRSIGFSFFVKPNWHPPRGDCQRKED